MCSSDLRARPASLAPAVSKPPRGGTLGRTGAPESPLGRGGNTLSQEVLYRKWRPQRFDDVVGQPAVTRTLRNALASRRLAHAFVFAGQRGRERAFPAHAVVFHHARVLVGRSAVRHEVIHRGIGAVVGRLREPRVAEKRRLEFESDTVYQNQLSQVFQWYELIFCFCQTQVLDFYHDLSTGIV